jgi:hypothetical protein
VNGTVAPFILNRHVTAALLTHDNPSLLFDHVRLPV